MKKFKRISIITTLAISLLTVGSASVFAAQGLGDTMATAVSLYTSGGGSTSSYAPIDGPNDNDWYLIDNTGSDSSLTFSFLMTPPSGLDYNMQLIKTDAAGNILSTSTYNYSGPGGVEGGATGLKAYQKAYIRVYSQGPSDYDSNRAYSLIFTKQN